MTKKHDPHGRLKQIHGVYARPAPPPPPRWIRHAHFGDTPILNERDNEAYEEADNFCQIPESQETHNKPMYNTFHDSGMSELSESHYQCEHACEQQCEHRPYSSGSTDSEDSGFRSSRSGQYLHSAQNSNAQEIPLFRPIKSHKENCTVSLPNGHSCDRELPDIPVSGEFHKKSSRHSKSRRRPSSCQKPGRHSVDNNANVCGRPSSDSCINPKNSFRKTDSISPSLIRLDPSPSFIRMDPSPSNCFIFDTSPSFNKLEAPPPITRLRGSPEDIDLQQIETDVNLTNIPTISQQCRPLQVTTAMVHRPHQNFGPHRQKMSYSVV
ncbi:hypothetical protein FSP39_002475 [Pinctada imbricata]|uniref:Uncharacterized protein n=1 Tax=Pinctada imbricata TaxID=66713 RepID=A0AA88XPE1_PINIB|nr:hypothetical protein FSP39_002475 [Pinctada imbricata]